MARRAEPQAGDDGKQEQSRGKARPPQPAVPSLSPQHLIHYRQPSLGGLLQRTHLLRQPIDAPLMPAVAVADQKIVPAACQIGR